MRQLLWMKLSSSLAILKDIHEYSYRKKKSERLKRREKRQVCNCMVSSINLQKCRLLSREPMTITTSCKNTEWMQRNSMKSFKSNTNKRRKRLMSSWRECLRHKKSWISSIAHSSKSRNIMRSWRVKLLSFVELPIELKKT